MAIPSGCVWQVGPNGNAANGAGYVSGYTGTDYTNQDSAQLTITGATCAQNGVVVTLGVGLAIDVTGNVCRIESGDNATAGYYVVVDSDDVSITLDRTPCSAGAGSNIVLRIGGRGGASQAGIERILTASVASNRIEIAGGSYSKTGGGTLTVAAGSITVAPDDGTLSVVQNAVTDLELTVLDDDGEPIDLSAATLQFVVSGLNLPNTVKFRLLTADPNLVVSGAGSNVVTVSLTSTHTATPGTWRYDLWRTDGDDARLASGVFTVSAAGAVSS